MIVNYRFIQLPHFTSMLGIATQNYITTCIKVIVPQNPLKITIQRWNHVRLNQFQAMIHLIDLVTVATDVSSTRPPRVDIATEHPLKLKDQV